MTSSSSHPLETAPTLSVDSRMGQYWNYEFDMPGFVGFLGQQGFDEAGINSLSIAVTNVDEETRAEYQKSNFFKGGKPPIGEYDSETKTILDYAFELVLEEKAEKNRSDADMRSPELIKSVEDEMNDTLLHELGHHIYRTRRDKRRRVEYKIEDTIIYCGVGAVVLGVAGLGVQRLLGPKGTGHFPGSHANKLGKVCARMAVTGGVMLLGVVAGEAVLAGDDYLRDRFVSYGRWRYNHERDEGFARAFAVEHRKNRFVHLSARQVD